MIPTDMAPPARSLECCQVHEVNYLLMDTFDETKAKFLAIRRAEHRLKQRLETIDFERALKDEIEELKEGMIRGKLPKITLERK